MHTFNNAAVVVLSVYCAVAGCFMPQQMGYAVVNWNLDTEDWRVGMDPPTFLQLLTTQLRKLNGTSVIHLQVRGWEVAVLMWAIFLLTIVRIQ